MLPNKFEWAVVGAGPAGIATIGNLLDAGIKKDQILWVDPTFKVGDIGQLWSQVSSNTSVDLFFDYFNFCQSFQFKKAPKFPIQQLNIKETCLLEYVLEPLQWITENLCKQVSICTDFVEKIFMSKNYWHLKTKQKNEFASKNIILAIGAEPNPLCLENVNVNEIPLQIALDKNKLKEAVNNKSKIAVFGSSHSAVILIRDLLELGVPQIDNFYNSAFRYAIFFDDWILFDDTGLKGKTAEWARKYLHGNLPKGLNRYLSTPENIAKHLTHSDAVIYATGFKRRTIDIEGLNPKFEYNPHCGIIAPGMFGVGIGFPEKKIDRYGHHEFSVGLWKFISYVKRILPLWLKYGL